MFPLLIKNNLIRNEPDFGRENMSYEKNLFSSVLNLNKKERDCNEFCSLISNTRWPSYNDMTGIDIQTDLKPFRYQIA